MEVKAGILTVVVEQNTSIKTTCEIFLYFTSNPLEIYWINFLTALKTKSLSNKSVKETIIERLLTIKLYVIPSDWNQVN